MLPRKQEPLSYGMPASEMTPPSLQMNQRVLPIADYRSTWLALASACGYQILRRQQAGMLHHL